MAIHYLRQKLHLQLLQDIHLEPKRDKYTDIIIITIIIYPLTARVVGAYSTALWDLPNFRPVHSLMLSSHLFLCLPCLLPPFTVPCKMVLARPDERET